MCFFVLFNDRAADGRKHSAKMREIEILKNAFCDVHFSFAEKYILETRCIKQHAFLVDPLAVSSVFFECSHFDVFLSPKKGAQTKKRDRNLTPASKFRSPGPPKGAHFD